MIKKAVIVAVVILLLGFFYNFAKQISGSLAVSQRLDMEAASLATLQKENMQLKKELAQSGSPEAVEEIARDKLGLSRPGETVMVIPPEDIDRLLAAQQVPVKVNKEPNWQGWLKLFWQ